MRELRPALVDDLVEIAPRREAVALQEQRVGEEEEGVRVRAALRVALDDVVEDQAGVGVAADAIGDLGLDEVVLDDARLALRRPCGWADGLLQIRRLGLEGAE